MVVKRIAALYLVFIMMLTPTTLSGCSKQSDIIDAKIQNADKNEPQITIEDYMGRKVQIPEKVERIGCLYAFSGHVAGMLGRGQTIVAVVDGLKRDVILGELVPQIKNAAVPVVSGAINIEELMKTKPDVVFIKSDTASNKGETEKLNKAGIPYLVVDYKNMKEQQNTVEMIGKALGVHDKAKEYTQYYNDTIDYIQGKTKNIPENQRIRVYHSVNEATRTDSLDTLPADWLQASGAINVSINEKLKLLEDKYYASLEQIFLWNPDVILANEPGVTDYIMKNNQWSTLKAVKNKKVYQMPIGISRWGHPGSLETPIAMLWTAKTIYPDYFIELDMKMETKKYYKRFFNLDLNDEIIAQILDGKGMRIPRGKE